jgi:hypothetical protein
MLPALDAGTPPGAPGRGDGGRPSLPTTPFPGLGDGGLPAFPGGGGLGNLPQLPGNDCLEGLRSCTAKPGALLFECAADARKCLNGAVVPPFQLP